MSVAPAPVPDTAIPPLGPQEARGRDGYFVPTWAVEIVAAAGLGVAAWALLLTLSTASESKADIAVLRETVKGVQEKQDERWSDVLRRLERIEKKIDDGRISRRGDQ